MVPKLYLSFLEARAETDRSLKMWTVQETGGVKGQPCAKSQNIRSTPKSAETWLA
jgi:hypothetical protein